MQSALNPRNMHQTSSKLLRTTDDQRNFVKDNDTLFATLIVSLPMTPHRVRFSRIEHTFTTEEALTNLGSLKFSQSNRMPDPRDPARIVTTTTTTTFSMAKEMAKSVCMRFLDARFIESLDGKTDFNSSRSVWRLSPKGMNVLSRFVMRHGIHQRHVNELLDTPRNMMQLMILERDPLTDEITNDSATVNVIFKRFAGDTNPNTKSSSSNSDSDSVNEYATGLLGVRLRYARKGDRNSPLLFDGKSALDWLIDCTSVCDKQEAFDLANDFLINGLIDFHDSKPQQHRFYATKHVTYAVTEKGRRAAGWISSPSGSLNGDHPRAVPGAVRDSNTNRMAIILRDPAFRLVFSEYLRETHCEENLTFYLEVSSFLAEYSAIQGHSSSLPADFIRETLASAYSLYNAFLAPGSPCELNIDHNLRNALAARMTRAVGENEQMLKSLDEVCGLFEQAKNSVFKLMASDSVPKFFREPKYASMLKERDFDSMLANYAPVNSI